MINSIITIAIFVVIIIVAIIFIFIAIFKKAFGIIKIIKMQKLYEQLLTPLQLYIFP